MSKKNKKHNYNNNAGYRITIWILSGVLVIALGVGGFFLSKSNEYATNLENLYQKNFYDLVDNINNTEIKLSKTIMSNDKNYQAKMLYEVSKNANMAQENLNGLPYSIGGLEESISFVNQLSGYSESLYKDLQNGKTLTNEQIATLDKVYDSVLTMKTSLNDMSQAMWKGYNISNSSHKIDGDFNEFTTKLKKVKNENVDYPAMIYDGPFSDSQKNKQVRGLEGSMVDENTAKNNIVKLFSDFDENEIQFVQNGKGKFETFDFSIKKKDDNQNEKEIAYIQMTKQGGNLLTLSAFNDKNSETISLENAEKNALDFAKKTINSTLKVVWSDIVGGNAFINLAPVESEVILYPDLIKLKIDLSNGNVLGYEATSYYTNHRVRSIDSPTITKEKAKQKIDKLYVVKEVNLSLIPLDWGSEVLTWEFVCKKGGDDFYIYIDAIKGEIANILKVIETNKNGNLLL